MDEPSSVSRSKTIQKWFWIDDANDPNELDPTTQRVSYLPNHWSITQAKLGLDSTQETIQASDDGRANLVLHSSGRKAIPFGKIGEHLQTPLPLTVWTV
jgi:hypothetical protein